MRVYLDACCLSRPFDDVSQDRVRLEAEAVVMILRRCELGETVLVGSEVLLVEVLRTPDMVRRKQLLAVCSAIQETVEADNWVRNRATELVQARLHVFDALHAASAEKGDVDILLSVDDYFLKKAPVVRVPMANPVDWLLTRKGKT